MHKLFSAAFIVTAVAAFSVIAAEAVPSTDAPAMKEESPSKPAFAIGLAAPMPAAEQTSGGAAMERCYGIAKAGKNDCSIDDVGNCVPSLKDGEGYLMLLKGTCERIAGGSLSPKSN